MNKLKSFLYILLRDHVTFGDVEGIIKNHVEIAETQITFEDNELSAYVDSLVSRLAKAVFRRRFVDGEVKKNEKGEEVPPETPLGNDDVSVAPARAVIGSRPFADKWRHWRQR